ncbi:MAG TPA: hypothetical protein VFG53_03270 [Anaeromyxobacter sp.]|nr:hypothetical protein [Anaeromyxobacter sp.]
MTSLGFGPRVDRAARSLAALAFFASALPVRAEGPASAEVPAALHATPGPGAEKAVSGSPPTAPALPAPARSGVWRSAARPPANAPAEAVLRAAGRKPSPASDPPPVIEIIWHAPGS